MTKQNLHYNRIENAIDSKSRIQYNVRVQWSECLWTFCVVTHLIST